MSRCCCWKRSDESLSDREESSNESYSIEEEEDKESATSRWPCCRMEGGGDDDDDPTVIPLQQLEAFLDRWSNRSTDRFREGWLVLKNVVITRHMITLLLPFILPAVHDDDDVALSLSSDHTPRTNGNNTPVKFTTVCIENSCRFFSHADVRMEDQGDNVCTPHDKRSFASALARVSIKLAIDTNCHDIISALMNMPQIDRLEVQTLVICQDAPLLVLEYETLGAMIQKSVQLKDLYLQLPFLDVPREFCDCLANSIQIQSLSLKRPWQTISNNDQREAIASNLVVGKDGNGVLERMLCNPQSQLVDLDLSWAGLEDYELMALAKLLPNSKVEGLDFCNSHIQPQGLLEFFRQLPKMHSLHRIGLLSNPWEEAALETRMECGTALLHALKENTSIDDVYALNHFPQSSLLWQYISLNRARRKLLTFFQEKSIPDGLWAHILAQAGKRVDDRVPCCIPIFDECRESYVYDGPATQVYFFLQNCPKLFP